MSVRVKPAPRSSSRRSRRSAPSRSLSPAFAGVVLLVAVIATFAVLILRDRYTLSLQSPLRVHWQWPFVVAAKVPGGDAIEAQADQFGHHLTAYQQYACNKFGPDCRIALAIQRAENPRGACEIYHYNTDGTLDWGYFQINTVHLTQGRTQSARPVGLPRQYRLCLPTLPGTRLPAVEHLQQRRLSEISAESVSQFAASRQSRENGIIVYRVRFNL